MAEPPHDREPKEGALLQRVRVGLTGLAFVFLLVLLATTFLRVAGDPGVRGNSATAVTANALDTPSDAPAQLGVAPGNPTGAAAPASAKPATTRH